MCSAGAASAQVVIRAQVGSPYRYYNRPYYAPRPYGYYPRGCAGSGDTAARVLRAAAPGLLRAAPARTTPPHYYGRGYGRRW
ncbi:MAG: hypothetical protein WKG07_12895 [Hymenobacter sp.]